MEVLVLTHPLMHIARVVVVVDVEEELARNEKHNYDKRHHALTNKLLDVVSDVVVVIATRKEEFRQHDEN